MEWDFWKGKRVLVTGHTGFKGTWLAHWLNLLGAEVTGLALDGARGCLEEGRQQDMDIRNLAEVSGFVDRTGPEIVFHLAAAATVAEGLQDPVRTYSTNVMGTVHVLEAIRRAGCVRAAVLVTSDKCYRDQGWLWGYRENDELGGNCPYSASKAACEHIAAAHEQAFASGKVGIATARCSNLVGGGDLTEGRLFPGLARHAFRREPLELRNPSFVRPWMYVLDALHGYLLLAHALYEHGRRFSGPWNFGPYRDTPRTVEELAGKFGEAWGEGATFLVCGPRSTVETAWLNLDPTQARTKLRWRQVLTIDDAVVQTVAFCKRHLGGEETRPIYQDCIRLFQAMADKGGA